MTTDDITARLDAIRARADAATQYSTQGNPQEFVNRWRMFRCNSHGKSTFGVETGRIDRPVDVVSSGGGLREADATFIAHSRTDVDQLERALRAVVELHEPMTVAMTDACSQCTGMEGLVAWPCHTVQTITEVLRTKGNDND